MPGYTVWCLFVLTLVIPCAFSGIDRSETPLRFDGSKNSCHDYSHYPVRFWSDKCEHNPYVFTNVIEMMNTSKRKFIQMKLTTPDGYILSMFRLISNSTETGDPVFFLNGLGTSSSFWVVTGNVSLPYYLSDRGYDVWLGSIRGTPFSETNLYHDIDHSAYWKYSLDEIAKYDVRMQLKYVANYTGKAGSIMLIGHSMGTTLSYMYATEFPEEAGSLLKGIISMAPAVTLMPPAGPVFGLLRGAMIGILLGELEYLDLGSILYDPTLKPVFGQLCSGIPYICSFVYEINVGYTYHFDPSYLMLVPTVFPEGYPVMVMRQFDQYIKTDVFSKFDYGVTRNLEIYGSPHPPRYDLGKVEIATHLLYGPNDAVVRPENARRLFNELGSPKKDLTAIPRGSESPNGYNHVDFVFAKDREQELFPVVLQLVKDWNN